MTTVRLVKPGEVIESPEAEMADESLPPGFDHIEYGDHAAMACTDLGNAERFVRMHGNGVRYCPPRKAWYIWDGKRWSFDERGVITHMAALTARDIMREAAECEDADQRKRLAGWAIASESASRIANMLTLARAIPGVPILLDELDSDPWLFNVANGTLDLRTGELGPHSRSNLISKLSPVVFEPTARHELWDRFLADITGGDNELLLLLQRIAGYSLTGLATEKRFFFAWGPPDTAKSTYVDALSTAMGDYHMSAAFSTWCETLGSGAGQNRGDLVRLAGARLVTSVEVKRGQRFDTETMKRFTGGDLVTAAAKWEADVQFRPQCKIWLAANDKPRAPDNDDGFWNRLMLVPFVCPIAHKDPTVKQRLNDPVELGPAVLAWAMRGCQVWQQAGLGGAASVTGASETYRSEQNPLGDFVSDYCVTKPGVSCTRKQLRTAYEEYAKDEGIKYQMGPKEFKQRIAEITGVSEARVGLSGDRGYSGIGVKVKFDRC